MSRKHYIAVARIISKIDLPTRHRKQIVDGFVALFENDNPNFDQSRFRAACEFKP